MRRPARRARSDNRMRWTVAHHIIRWAAEITGRTGYNELILVGRCCRGRRLSDTALSLPHRTMAVRAGVAWLAAALSSLAVMQIQQSHFMTVDTFAVFFTTAALYCAVRATGSLPDTWPDLNAGSGRMRVGAAPGRPWGWHVLFGLATGMAVASRINLAPLLGVALVTTVIAARATGIRGHRNGQRSPRSRSSSYPWPSRLTGGISRDSPDGLPEGSGETTALTLRINPDWMESMRVAAAESNCKEAASLGAVDWTYPDTLPLANMVIWGWVALGLTACAGLVWATRRALRSGDRRARTIVVAWTGGYLLFMGTRRVMSMRYFLPIYPFMALLAAWALIELWRDLEPSRCSTPGGPALSITPAQAVHCRSVTDDSGGFRDPGMDVGVHDCSPQPQHASRSLTLDSG